jgi:hypothetical protein
MHDEKGGCRAGYYQAKISLTLLEKGVVIGPLHGEFL